MPQVEGACFLLCGTSTTDREVRLLCRIVIPVPPAAYLERRADFLSLDSSSYVAAAKIAKEENLSIVFVHSHPGGLREFSEQDDREDPKLQEFFAKRVPDRIHGSLVLTNESMIGRVWVDGGFQKMDLIRSIGRRFSFVFQDETDNSFSEFFDRQVRAFGADIQTVLSRLHIGVVGAGGTGSAVIEQLTRLGVGELSDFDEDVFEPSNVNRVYGSSSEDGGKFKVEIAERNVAHIKVGTKVNSWPKHITKKSAALALRDCDLVFGCTDKQAPRAVLTQLSLRYLIPVIDMGVVIESEEGVIRDVVGRVTTLFAGEACLYCRGRIDPHAIMYEGLPEEERLRQQAQGYVPELATRAPAVVPFTTAVAATAISEFLHRITGFMGATRESTEILQFFDKTKITANRPRPGESCICADRDLWGSGDSPRFLGMFG